MGHPALQGYYTIASALAVNRFDVWLLDHSVQVLVDAIDQIGEELLGVVLRVARKDRVELGHRRFQVVGTVCHIFFAPHVLDEPGIVAGKLPTRAQYVVLIDLELVVLLEEVLGEGRGVGQALQAAVHETGVAQVAKTHATQRAGAGDGHVDRVELLLFQVLAAAEMIGLVLLHAVLVAVGHFLALAGVSELLVLEAPLALGLVGSPKEPVTVILMRFSDEEVPIVLSYLLYFVLLVLNQLTQAVEPIRGYYLRSFLSYVFVDTLRCKALVILPQPD